MAVVIKIMKVSVYLIYVRYNLNEMKATNIYLNRLVQSTNIIITSLGGSTSAK